MEIIDLGENDYWLAVAVTGMITAPIVPLGLGPDMYICKESDLPENVRNSFSSSLKKSFESFGLEASEKLTLNNPKLLIVPLCDAEEETIKNALIVADMALALFNKKYFSAKTRFISWDRQQGKAVGVISSQHKFSPISDSSSPFGPGIVQPLGTDIWDWLLGDFLRGTLNDLGKRVYKCLEWEREAQFSSHITHKFAFNWIGLESMVPDNECTDSALIRRYCMVVGAPRKADSFAIMNSLGNSEIFKGNINPMGKVWIKEIKQMYKYRCAIFHEGSSELTSEEINPKRVEWYYHISKTLSMRVVGYAIQALVSGVDNIDDFWSKYMVEQLFSENNHWIKNGTFHLNDILNHDWENGEKYFEM
ncbi:hypothetical protein [Aliivibrio fischeri]|uniref:hypothetical protein n=1 Tax=Aliivibrio fischeri TaxID=668 RepID=UPI001F1FF854|nr:hypothetical protein [Aliivibrio fischeri]MCE7535592.1 hypothetical protein [Aliivibrio fischeri]MCE7559242.1 hypothetical protein [Aliivibrio fischeri]